jgi:C4-dicarboxylate-specific signal transduction histidine kinase
MSSATLRCAALMVAVAAVAAGAESHVAAGASAEDELKTKNAALHRMVEALTTEIAAIRAAPATTAGQRPTNQRIREPANQRRTAPFPAHQTFWDFRRAAIPS